MSYRVIKRIKSNKNLEGGGVEQQQKKLNRRSKLFYVTCDYIEVNGSSVSSASLSGDQKGSRDSDDEVVGEGGNRDGDVAIKSYGNDGGKARSKDKPEGATDVSTERSETKTQSALIINVLSETVDFRDAGNDSYADDSTLSVLAARERKKRNRKSKLFYVSCDQIDVNSILHDHDDVTMVNGADASSFLDERPVRKGYGKSADVIDLLLSTIAYGSSGGVYTKNHNFHFSSL